MALTLEQLNAADLATAASLLDGLYEHSPWIAEAALAQRPFRSLAQIKYAMAQVLDKAPVQAKLDLIRAHPELAGKAMETNTLTAESTNEQNKAGLTRCTPEELEHIRKLNAEYGKRFGFPFILAVRGPRGAGLAKAEIIETFERRLHNHPDFELGEALRNIHRIAEIRLNDKFGYTPELGNDVWDWQEKLAQHSDPGYAEKGQLTVTYLTDAHRACAQRISHWMRDCGFDEVEIDAVGNVVGRYKAATEDARTLLTGSLRHRAQRRQVRRAPGHFCAHGLRARTAPRGQASAVRHRGDCLCRRRRPALQGHLPGFGRAHRALQPRLAGPEGCRWRDHARGHAARGAVH